MTTKKTTKRVAKKAVKLPKDWGKVRDPETGEQVELPDSEATVEQVKDWGRFKPQGEVNETSINYWKYACIAILLGIVTAMILSTPTIISMFDACVQ